LTKRRTSGIAEKLALARQNAEQYAALGDNPRMSPAAALAARNLARSYEAAMALYEGALAYESHIPFHRGGTGSNRTRQGYGSAYQGTRLGTVSTNVANGPPIQMAEQSDSFSRLFRMAKNLL
jgi:hypothetical protein